jgi:hypothetical protein
MWPASGLPPRSYLPKNMHCYSEPLYELMQTAVRLPPSVTHDWTELGASVTLCICFCVADPGQTHNTSETLKRLINSNPQLVILLADFTYADNWKNADQFPPPDFDFVTCELQRQACCSAIIHTSSYKLYEFSWDKKSYKLQEFSWECAL